MNERRGAELSEHVLSPNDACKTSTASSRLYEVCFLLVLNVHDERTENTVELRLLR